MMFKRSVVRVLAAVVALVAGLAVSAGAALATNLPVPVDSVPAGDSGTNRLAAVRAPAPNLQILGMDWELTLAVAVLIIAAALFLATAMQRRHVAHV